MNDKTYYAFWKTDRFPFCFWGKLVDINDDGTVKIKGYFETSFTVFLILPEKPAIELINKLRQLNIDRLDAQYIIDDKFNNKLRELITIPN